MLEMKPQLLTTVSIIIFASVVTSSTIIRHPRFRSEVQYGIVDTGTWHPSYTTSVRGLDFRTTGQEKLRLQLDIEHLPDKNNFQLDIVIQCSPSEVQKPLQYILPFKFHGEILCGKVFPFTVTTERSQWLTADHQPMYSLTLALNRVRGTDQQFQETFRHHVRLKMAFHNAKWRIESNSIYLWSWDSAFKFNNQPKPGNSEPQYFLTDASMDLMLNMELKNSKPFDSIQFFEPTLMNLVTSASEYVKHYLDIEAVMLLGIGIAANCHTSLAKYTVVFGTRKAGVIEEHDKMLKVAQVDGITGRLTFSRYGLSAAMTRFYAMNQKHFSYNKGASNYRLRICSGIELSHTLTPVSAFKSVMLKSNPKLNYKDHGSLHDDCQIVGPSTKRVTLFARSGYNRLICPIVCSNIEEPYLFYKGKIALTPNSRFDRTQYLNGSISAYKQGIVIDIRDDLTHEDAGQYKCTAGKKTVTFDVDVVSLPYFTRKLLSGKNLIGSLPNRVYAVEGEGYSVSCTVYFTGLSSVTLLPEFYLKSDSPDGKFRWKMESAANFIAEAETSKEFRCKAGISETSTTYSKTIKLTVQGVRREGRLRQSFFDHRFVCNASASATDMKRYGLFDYSAQSGADVSFVQRPSFENFGVNLNDCCLKSCTSGPSGNCKMEVYLKNDSRDFLTNIGIKFSAAFQVHNGAPKAATTKTFDAALVKATIDSPDSPSSMSNEQRKNFAALAPIFRYHFTSDATREASFTILRGPESDTSGDPVCMADPSCIYSTGFDRGLTNILSVNSAITRATLAAGSHLPSWLSSSQPPTKAVTSGLASSPASNSASKPASNSASKLSSSPALKPASNSASKLSSEPASTNTVSNAEVTALSTNTTSHTRDFVFNATMREAAMLKKFNLLLEHLEKQAASTIGSEGNPVPLSISACLVIACAALAALQADN